MGQEARFLREGMDALTWGVYASCRRKSDSNSFALNGLIWLVQRHVSTGSTDLCHRVPASHPLRDIEMTSLPDVDKYEGECGRAIFRSAVNPY
jgi:hypothetical protein